MTQGSFSVLINFLKILKSLDRIKRAAEILIFFFGCLNNLSASFLTLFGFVLINPRLKDSNHLLAIAEKEFSVISSKKLAVFSVGKSASASNALNLK